MIFHHTNRHQVDKYSCINKTNHSIHWMAIYSVDNVIHSLNNPGKALLLGQGMLALFETFQSCMSSTCIIQCESTCTAREQTKSTLNLQWHIENWAQQLHRHSSLIEICFFETNSVLVQKKNFYQKFSAILVADMHADAGQMTCTQLSYWLLTLKNTCTCTCRCTYFFVDWADTCSWQQTTFVTTIKSTSIYNTNQLRL